MIKNKIQSKVSKAFDKKLSDAVTVFTCSKQIKSGTFDYATQKYPMITAEVYSGRAVFGSYKKDLVKPFDYQVEDIKATVLQNELSQVPQIGDIWSSNKGQFKVLNIGADPTSSIWVVQLRKVTA